ncbi:DUF6326 family protein [Candidatus Gracilibacteria bacterium]|nr:DUF6326 family protein [Candidatus Gracilibacteria bacterium]
MNNKLDTGTKISLLWIVVLMNMIFADILSLFIPGVQEQLIEFSGETSMPIPMLMLIGAVVHQIPIFMIFLSRVLKYSLNRKLNIFAAIFTIIYVVGGGSLFPHYIFIASIEVLCMIYIIWIAYRWKEIDV